MNLENKTKCVQNFLKAAHFEYPQWIPCRVVISPATWQKYREALEEIVLKYPRIFPGFEKGTKNYDLMKNRRYREGRFTDSWGCTWANIAEGLASVVVEHPLEDWDNFESFQPPDPLAEDDDSGEPPDWVEIEKNLRQAKRDGGLARGHLRHGFMYMRLWYLRGFENFMLDIATDEPRLPQLIAMVLENNIKLIRKYLDMGAEYMFFGDDLGLQDRLPISPEKFSKYLKPCFAKMFGLCRECGVGVYLHSDGHMLEIIPDLIQCGVNIVNPQIRANSLRGLEKVAKGKVCIRLDLDRQLFPFATPEQVKAHIKEAVDRLNLPQGGLMLSASCLPDIPLENIQAICETFEELGGPSV
jgi:hypothetical protein